MSHVIQSILKTLKSETTVSDVRICFKSTLVVSNHLGMAFNFPRDLCRRSSNGPIKNCGSMIEMKATDIANYALSKNWAEASIGVAAINSIIDTRSQSVTVENGREIIFSRCSGKRVAMVGHFNFAEKLRRLAGHLDILELYPQPGDLPATEAENVIPKADIVIITGTTLVNHTFDDLAKLAKNAYSIVLGPTTIMSPILFDYGIDDICGIQVTDTEEAIRFLSQGGSFRDIVGVKQIVMNRKSCV